jgi:hypothetical protein
MSLITEKIMVIIIKKKTKEFVKSNLKLFKTILLRRAVKFLQQAFRDKNVFFFKSLFNVCLFMRVGFVHGRK